VNRWNSLDQETVHAGSINSFKGRLDKIEKQSWVFYGLCIVRKAIGLMEMGPHEATQGELQGGYWVGVQQPNRYRGQPKSKPDEIHTRLKELRDSR